MLKSPSPASSGQGRAWETDPPSQCRPGSGQPPSIPLVAVHLLLRRTFMAPPARRGATSEGCGELGLAVVSVAVKGSFRGNKISPRTI